MNPQEFPELDAFLSALAQGQPLTGTVAAIERFGVFVKLDDGPDHPNLPGVGFITIPDLAWERIDAVTDFVQVGQRITCEFLLYDTWNMEARLSLRAMRPDPLQVFADEVAVGQRLPGEITEVVPFGVFVRVADDVVGLVREQDLASTLQVGDELTVVLVEIDRELRRVLLASDRG